MVFAAVPEVVVAALYGPAFHDAIPYVIAIGCVGLSVSMDNLFVQFSIAVGDYWFVPILAASCATEAGLIVLFHAGIGLVVADVLAVTFGLMMVLGIRCYFVLNALPRATIVEDEPRLT